MESSIHMAMRFRRATILFILVALAIMGIDQASASGGPHLVASVVNGTLQIERPGTIWIEIKNDVNSSASGQKELCEQLPAWFEEIFRTNASDAVAITAELISKDSRIRMLSGPQLAGSLPAGYARTLQYNALAGDMAEQGVYPMDLNIACQRLSNLAVSGDPEQPNIAFHYQNVTESIPVNINVISGPRISIEDAGESTISGKESDINVVFSNRGDISAEDIHVGVLNGTPFRSGDASLAVGTLEPGASTSAKFWIEIENGTAPGAYALQFKVSYREGSVQRNEEVAAIVTIGYPSEFNWILAPVAGVFLLALGTYLAAKFYPKRFRKEKKKKW